jgi:hypothetical protein
MTPLGPPSSSSRGRGRQSRDNIASPKPNYHYNVRSPSSSSSSLSSSTSSAIAAVAAVAAAAAAAAVSGSSSRLASPSPIPSLDRDMASLSIKSENTTSSSSPLSSTPSSSAGFRQPSLADLQSMPSASSSSSSTSIGSSSSTSVAASTTSSLSSSSMRAKKEPRMKREQMNRRSNKALTDDENDEEMESNDDKDTAVEPQQKQKKQQGNPRLGSKGGRIGRPPKYKKKQSGVASPSVSSSMPMPPPAPVVVSTPPPPSTARHVRLTSSTKKQSSKFRALLDQPEPPPELDYQPRPPRRASILFSINMPPPPSPSPPCSSISSSLSTALTSSSWVAPSTTTMTLNARDKPYLLMRAPELTLAADSGFDISDVDSSHAIDGEPSYMVPPFRYSTSSQRLRDDLPNDTLPHYTLNVIHTEPGNGLERRHGLQWNPTNPNVAAALHESLKVALPSNSAPSLSSSSLSSLSSLSSQQPTRSISTIATIPRPRPTRPVVASPVASTTSASSSSSHPLTPSLSSPSASAPPRIALPSLFGSLLGGSSSSNAASSLLASPPSQLARPHPLQPYHSSPLPMIPVMQPLPQSATSSLLSNSTSTSLIVPQLSQLPDPDDNTIVMMDESHDTHSRVPYVPTSTIVPPPSLPPNEPVSIDDMIARLTNASYITASHDDDDADDEAASDEDDEVAAELWLLRRELGVQAASTNVNRAQLIHNIRERGEWQSSYDVSQGHMSLTNDLREYTRICPPPLMTDQEAEIRAALGYDDDDGVSRIWSSLRGRAVPMKKKEKPGRTDKGEATTRRIIKKLLTEMVRDVDRDNKQWRKKFKKENRLKEREVRSQKKAHREQMWEAKRSTQLQRKVANCMEAMIRKIEAKFDPGYTTPYNPMSLDSISSC